MTSFAKGIDKTEGAQASGLKWTLIAGSGGVTAGQTVKYDGSGNRTVIACSGISDDVIGFAAETGAQGDAILVLGPGCLINSGQTLTLGAKIEPSTGGYCQDYTSGTVIGRCETSATSASLVRIK